MQLVFNNNDVVIMQNEETAIKLFKVQLPFKKGFVFIQANLFYLAVSFFYPQLSILLKPNEQLKI